MLPVKPRKKGVVYDTEINNIDMAVNFNDYPVENITVPILVINAKDDPNITEGILNFIEKNSSENTEAMNENIYY